MVSSTFDATLAAVLGLAWRLLPYEIRQERCRPGTVPENPAPFLPLTVPGRIPFAND